ncbi:MAG: hypothetical protein ACPGN3_09360 [Opitutales bacterium]
MKLHYILLSLSLLASASPLMSVALVGTDFSDSTEFNEPGGEYLALGFDDFDLSDGVSVSDWSFPNEGGLDKYDENAQVGLPTDNVAKFNGIADAPQPGLGSSGAALPAQSFSVTIDHGTVVDLTSITFDWRQATGSPNKRWLAFETSLESGIIFSEEGVLRDGYDAETISFDGDQYLGLTDTTVTFSFYAGGTNSGDIDIDTIVLSGALVEIPESSMLFGVISAFALGFVITRRQGWKR